MFNLLAFSLKMPVDMGEIGGRMEQITSTSYIGDLLILAVAGIMVVLFGFWLDKHNILIGILGTYISWITLMVYPYGVWGKADWVGEWWFKLILFVAGMVIYSIILSATRLFKFYYTKNFFTRWWQAAINGLLYTGLLAAIVLSIFPIDFLTQFSENSLRLFASEIGRFGWAVGPLLGLFLTRVKRKGPGRPSY